MTQPTTKSEIRIAKRLVHYMLEVSNQQTDMQFFQGLGMALAIVFEELTGRTAKTVKPKDLMQWALDLPDVPMPRVSLT
jgi:hypothetical protein